MATERSAATSAQAQLLAWLGAALLSALLALSVFTEPTVAFAGSLALDAGQHVAVGLLAAGVIWLWQRFVPARRRASWVLLVLLASMALSELVVSEDLEGLANKLTFAPVSPALRLHVLVGLVSLLVPMGALLGSKISFAALAARPPRIRRWVPIAGVLLGFAVIVVHSRLLDQNYPGVHLVGTVVGTVFAGACAAGWAVPLPGRRLSFVCIGLLAIPAVMTTALRPRDRWVMLAMRRTTSVFVPLVARLHDREMDDGGAIPEGAREWFVSREGAQPIAATSPRLIEKPTVILWTVDALRPDVLGDRCSALPNLCELIAESTSFTNARSAAPKTTPSLTSLFTSRYYSQIYWQDVTMFTVSDRLFPHEDGSIRFPELLTGAGIRTFNAGGHGRYVESFGIARGFAEEKSIGITASAITSLMVRELARGHKRQQFMYAHLPEPHSPYDGAGATPFEKYIGEIAAVDRQLGVLRAAIARSPRASSTIVIFSADHGEAFGEHGAYFHGSTLYDEMIRIPLIVHVPGQPARTISEPVSLVDVGPTILDLFGLSTPGAFMGSSLVPLLAGGQAALSRPIVVDSSRWRQAMVFPDGIKIIYDERARAAELYDTIDDPKEEVDLTEDRPALLRERLGTLRAFMRAHTLERPGYKKPFRK